MTLKEYNNCVDSFSDGLYRFALKSTRSKAEAVDLVQESFEKLWNRVKSVDYQTAKSYLFTTLYHSMIDNRRKNKRIISLESSNYMERGSSTQYSDLHEILNRAVENLPEIQKNVVLLRDYEGYSYKEIAEITELSQSQVKVYIYRARIFLRNYIGTMEAVI